jgi:hypothetical protein
MNHKEHMQYIDSLRKPMLILGLLLAGAGGSILLYLGFVVLQVINSPEDIKIVELVLTHTKIDEVAVSVLFNDQHIEITLSQSVRIIIFLFLGVFILSALARILQVLLTSGISIIQFAATDSQNKLNEK